MRRGRAYLIHSITVAAAAFFLTAADDIQVLRTPRSTLSIYSYGGAAPSRAIPEYRDDARRARRRAGALTDVAAVPPRAVAAPPTATPVSTNAPQPKGTAAPVKTFGTSSMSAPSPRDDSVPKTLATSRVVTIAWNASPESSVAGHHVYTGDSSGQYAERTSLGNQTSAELVIGQSTLYLAVSAYTAEGLESPLSDELVVLGDELDAAATSGGFQILGSSIR